MNKLTRELNDKDIIRIIQNGAERDLEYRTIKQDIIEDVPVPTPSYLVYTAIASQSGPSGVPTFTVLENTIGNIVWSFVGTGVYDGELTGAFPSASTVGFVTTQGSTGSAYTFNLSAVSSDFFRIYSFDSTGTAANDWQAFIEIRVY